jgi:hypothetical protein
MAELAPHQRRRLLSVLTAAIDLGDEHGPAPVAHSDTYGVGVIKLPTVVSARPECVVVTDARLVTTPVPHVELPEPRHKSSPKGLRPAEQVAASRVLSVLRSSPQGMSFRHLADAIQKSQSILSPTIRHLISTGQVRKSGQRGTPGVRYHLSQESPQ